jgi:hypothetical protein
MTDLLLPEQRKFDELQFDQAEWQTEQWRDQKTRHIALHIGKAVGKLIGVTYESRRIVAADLSIYRSQLINTHEIDPSCAVDLPDKFLHLTAEFSTISAFAHLANYLEPGEHSAVIPSKRDHHTLEAVRHLHHASLSLAGEHEIDLRQIHMQRLRQNLGSRAAFLD